MPVDPRAQSLLAMLHRIDAPRLPELPIEVARRNFQKMYYLYRGEVCAAVDVEACVLPRRAHEGGDLAARLYRPRGATTSALPVLLWLHGGGWTLGDLASYDPLCRALAHAAGVAVLALDYRLAPEEPFPGALNDAEFALRRLVGGGFAGVDTTRIAVGGDSAGANLAAVLALIARDAGIVLAQQLLIYPVVDLTSERPSHAAYGQGYFLERDALAWFAHNYLASPAEAADWRVSPLRAASLQGLAPAHIMTAECDPLADEGLAYAQALEAAGVPCRYRQFAGMIHGFISFARLFDEAQTAINMIADALRADFGMEDLT